MLHDLNMVSRAHICFTCYDCNIAKDSSPKMLDIEFLTGCTPKFDLHKGYNSLTLIIFINWVWVLVLGDQS